MGIQFPPIAFLYLLYLFIYVLFFYIIHIFVQWYKALLNLNLNYSRRFFRTLVSFDSAFARKDVFPFTQRISKFSFSISEGNREPSSDQLLGQFPQNVSFSSCKNSRHFVFRHLSVSADQYQRGALLARLV